MNLPIAPLVAALAGAATATVVALVPAPVLGGLVMDSGLPAILAAAEPPLGATARAALALGIGGGVAVFAWFALFLIVGSRSIALGRSADVETAEEGEPVPAIRRADAHPDARPRAPLLATRDLGTPFLEVRAARDGDAMVSADNDDLLLADPIDLPAERPLPDDLNQPLAAFDAAAIPARPRTPPARIAPLRRPTRPSVFDENERFETFELTPAVRPAPRTPEPAAPRERIARPQTEATVHALLDRLEQGVVKRGLAHRPTQPRREAEHGLQEALVSLRNLARQA